MTMTALVRTLSCSYSGMWHEIDLVCIIPYGGGSINHLHIPAREQSGSPRTLESHHLEFWVSTVLAFCPPPSSCN